MEQSAEGGMMSAKPQDEHLWLRRLLGEWHYEGVSSATVGGEAHRATGVERVRPLGDLWVVAESEGEMPGGGQSQAMMTLGFDPRKGHFVGTWFGSMMHELWTYQGSLDSSGKVLTLDCQGPSMTGDGSFDSYRDVIEIVDPNLRLLRGLVQLEDGSWQEFMVTTCRRKV